MSDIIELTDNNYKDLLDDSTIIINFYADWSGPCRLLKPTINTISENDNFKVFDVNVEVEEELIEKFRITSIPSTIIYNKKTKPQVIIGAVSEKEILIKINSLK